MRRPQASSAAFDPISPMSNLAMGASPGNEGNGLTPRPGAQPGGNTIRFLPPDNPGNSLLGAGSPPMISDAFCASRVLKSSRYVKADVTVTHQGPGSKPAELLAGGEKLTADAAVPSASDELAWAGDLRRVGSHPNHWYPVAWSKEVKPGRTLGTRFAGEPIVIVRTLSGTVFALEDRCAHRQVPLRFGVVTGETLRCCYHGWTYDGSGRCVDVPYLDKHHTPNGVRAYPCRENAGLIFV